MVDVIDGSETVSTHGIINWILLLVIFSVITVVGNWIGYKHPISDSLIGMLILSIITLAGLLLAVSVPMVPTSPFVVKYVGQVELLSIVTVFLAYVGIGIGKNWDQFKAMGWRGMIVTICIITGTYLGSALIAHIVLVLSGTPWC